MLTGTGFLVPNIVTVKREDLYQPFHNYDSDVLINPTGECTSKVSRKEYPDYEQDYLQ